MTAELCDCYPTRKVGVLAVLDAVLEALPEHRVVVWGVDRRFHEVEDLRQRPLLAAAANWLALAELAARLVPDVPAILIDIGTTTTDLIPMDRGDVAARGRCDTERLQTGELVYAGVRRTPVHALATELPYRGVPTGLAAELFASTLDVYLILGDIESNPLDLSTADGRPATPEAARDRLARMIGADRDSFSADDAYAFARAADSCLMERLARAAERACRSHDRHSGRRGDRRVGRLPRRPAGPTPGRPTRLLDPPGRSLGTGRLGRRLRLRARPARFRTPRQERSNSLALPRPHSLVGEPPVIKTPVSVIKVGGSLLDWPELPSRLTRFLQERRQTAPGVRDVLICGGGPFVDSVRRLDRVHHLGDYACHRLALQSMDLAATVLLCMLPRAMGVDRTEMLDLKWKPDDIPLFVTSMILDELEEEQASPLPQSWDVSSDTIAAWIAGQLKAQSLVLLKSASLPAGATREVAAKLKLVDPFFPLISSPLRAWNISTCETPPQRPCSSPDGRPCRDLTSPRPSIRIPG